MAVTVTYLGVNGSAAQVLVEGQFVYDEVVVPESGLTVATGGGIKTTTMLILPEGGETPEEAATRWAQDAFGIGVTVTPDVTAAKLAVMTTISAATIVGLGGLTGIFIDALNAGNWAAAQGMLDAAQGLTLLSTAERDAIAAIFVTYNIPVI